MRPVLFEIGQTPISSYGVLVSLGWLAGALWLLTQLKNAKGTLWEFWALGYTIVFGGLLGAKLGVLIVEWDEFIQDPMAMIRDWRTGWVFWAGFAGTLLAGWAFQKVYNRLYKPRKYLPVADYFGAALPLGHSIGRLGCFADACCHGCPTNVPWGVRFMDPASSLDPVYLGVPVHPTQLYESAGELALFALMAYYVLPAIRRGLLTYGTAFLGYIVLYGIMRFGVEFLRCDDRGAFLSPALSPSQWWSLAAALVAGALLWRQGIIERDPRGRSIYIET